LYRIGFIIVAVLAVALGLLIGTLNSDSASVDLLWIQLNWPLGMLILCVFVTGLLAGLLLAWVFSVLPLRARLRKSREKDGYASSNALKTP
jgi:uncharacterized integral membrane protein